MTTKRANWHHYPLPWRFEEEGYNGGPCVKDASGSVFVILFWPLHPPEQTESAEQETYALGRAIVDLAVVGYSGEVDRCSNTSARGNLILQCVLPDHHQGLCKFIERTDQ